MTVIKDVQVAGFPGVSLNNETVQVIFVPELGGKMVSLVRVASGYEFLLQPQDVGRRYGRATYGDRLENFDTSGFDECFPTISACQYPLNPEVALPDHGELWSVAWRVRKQDECLYLEAMSRALHCRFRKRVRLDEDQVILEYELANESDQPVFYLWSAHPLLRVETGAEITLPPEVNQMWIHWSRQVRLGNHGDLCCWPGAVLNGEHQDLSTIRPWSSQTADKLFTNRLKNGYCSLYHPENDESITFQFDPQQVPYIGLWMCTGGWPETNERGHLTVALEPCSGRPDALEEAYARGESAQLKPREVRKWWLRLRIKQGRGAHSSTSNL